MSRLRVTLIDVGWGDSLLLESEDNQGGKHYALVDSNDSPGSRSSRIFLKRFFERNGVVTTPPVFEWVLLTHAHADHGQGLKGLLEEFGTRQLWYPTTASLAVFYSDLIRFATRFPKVSHHQAVDNTHQLPPFGAVPMDILWPPPGLLPANENNNSVVLTLQLNNVSFVLTGDAEADGVWNQIASQIPANTTFFKVPHHGSTNGMFDTHGGTPWLSAVVSSSSNVGISSHVLPFPHPSTRVIKELNAHGVKTYRTDQHYHVTFETDGIKTTVHYSHV